MTDGHGTEPLAALLACLAPFTPMLFQGEDHGERAPSLFCPDHTDPDMATAGPVRDGVLDRLAAAVLR